MCNLSDKCFQGPLLDLSSAFTPMKDPEDVWNLNVPYVFLLYSNFPFRPDNKLVSL